MRASLAGWLCLAVAACATGPSAERAAAPATSGAAPQAMPPEDPRAEITRLSTEIAQQQQQQTSAATPMAAGASQTCSDVCTLSESICKNADRICELADGMPGDDWAAGKCRDAKQACTDAKQRCTDCS